jgi:hypothetical protein
VPDGGVEIVEQRCQDHAAVADHLRGDVNQGEAYVGVGIADQPGQGRTCLSCVHVAERIDIDHRAPLLRRLLRR